MRVRMSFTFEVDEKAWCEDYGMDPKDKQAIRDDVLSYVSEHLPAQSPRLRSVDKNVKP
jgi:hypothetical protein